MRNSVNGRPSALQAEDDGSNPLFRSILRYLEGEKAMRTNRTRKAICRRCIACFRCRQINTALAQLD